MKNQQIKTNNIIDCPNCGTANVEGNFRCTACGGTFTKTCPSCGSKNPINTYVCMECGKNLENYGKDPKILSDPVAEMFEPIKKARSAKLARKSVFKLIIGLFVFTFLYLSKICEGHPYILLLSGLVSGVIALVGLIELTFWFIDDKELREEEFVSIKLENDFPENLSSDRENPASSLEEIDKDLEKSAKASEKMAAMEMGTPVEAVPARIERPASADKHYESLVEFLEDGVSTEIDEVKEKLSKSPDNYALKLRLAQLFEERGDIESAIANLEGCIKNEPDSAEVYLYYGTLLRQKGLLNEARKAFEKALGKNRFMAKAFYQLGLLERTRGNLGTARELLQRAIQLTPDDPYAHYQLGMTYKELGNIELAIMEVRRATILHPTDSYGHSKLGQFYQQLRKYDLAIPSYSAAISLKPRDAFVLEKLAEVLAAKGDHERAIEIYQEALSNQFHQKTSTMLSMAKSLKAVGRWGDLEDFSKEILRFEPDNYEATFMLAYSISKLNRIEEATEMFEALVHSTNASCEAWIELGKLYQRLGITEKAVAAFTRAATAAPNQAEIWNTVGILLSNEKIYVEALKAFKKAASYDYVDQAIAENLRKVQKKVEIDAKKVIESRKRRIEKVPDDIDAYYEIGKAYERIELLDEALMAYQKILAINPKFIPGLMSYAELLRKMGKLKMAIRCYREIIKLEPDNLEAHLFMVNANINLGFINEAYKYATIAERLAADDQRVHFFLGKIYFAKGLAPRALKEFSFVADSMGDPDLISWAELMRKRLLRTNKQ